MTVKSNGNCSPAGSDKVKVAVRVRPFNRREANTRNVVTVSGQQTVFLVHPRDEKPPRPFSFDFCFSHEETSLDNSVDSVESTASMESQSEGNASQEQVFRAIGTEVVENAFLGFNTCVFAYGQTGSGKSHTMMGTAEEPGIVPRLCNELFYRVIRETSESSQFKVEISFYEVYNERIRDLLGQKRQSLKVREHSLFGPMVEGLSAFVVSSYAQIEQMIAEGNSARTTAATLMNDQSSRSHSVFTIKLTQTISDADDKTFTGEKASKISLVDLAGSERVQKTGATGKRLEEGGNINKSLTALGKVISALATESQRGGTHHRNGSTSAFVPYRDSVLTWLLKENLGGNSRTTMIATISPSSDNFEETLSTLRFADRAKRIQTHAVVNEDPNAKIIRELREEVERLRLLVADQSQSKQREAFQEAIEQIAERHQLDKKKALEQQYEQFSQYIRELTLNLQTPSTSSTPMTPFGCFTPCGLPQSRADLNNNNNVSKSKFLEWAHRREELFAQRLSVLRLAIKEANLLANEANSLVALLAQSRWPRRQSQPLAQFSVSLHIPVRNLRPSKLAPSEEEEETEGCGTCVCEPIIVVSWDGQPGPGKGQQLSVEQMESKVAELRSAVANIAMIHQGRRTVEEELNQVAEGNEPCLPIFGNFYTKRESHTLIGVANVYLGMLFHDLPALDSQVFIINQQGEICGKLHVQIQGWAASESEEFASSNGSTPEEECNNNGREARPEDMLGRTMLCKIEVKKASNLPAEQSNLVFCQYSFFEQPQVVVASQQAQRTHQGQQPVTVVFDRSNEFEFVCTRPFLDYVEEDALSIEVWGHRYSLDGDDEEEEEGEERQQGIMESEDFDGEWEDVEYLGEFADAKTMRRSASEQQNVWQVAERKKKSLQERWQEVTRRLELWLEILELDSEGRYAPVPVDTGSATGGIYRLRQGQQRRIRLFISSQQSEGDGALPLCLEDIISLSIGSPIVQSVEETGEGKYATLDSYHERDLARLRHQWEAVLRQRANYLQREIQALASKGVAPKKSGGLEEEREKSLLFDWVELIEERNAISLPTTGIPGAPPTGTQPCSHERHCPILFLQEQENSSNLQSSGEENAQQNEDIIPLVGASNLLAYEMEDNQLDLVLAEKEAVESCLCCTCPWDSSLHDDCPALNRPSRGEEQIFLVLKAVFRISQPFCMDLMLRKRFAVQVFASSNAQQHSATTNSSNIRWLPWASGRGSSERQRLPTTGTGLYVDVVGCIPRSSALDMENRQMLARLAVQHASQEQPNDQEEEGEAEHSANKKQTVNMGELAQQPNNNYLSEYVSKTMQAVEWLIKMDRLRQEEAIARALARQRRAHQPNYFGSKNLQQPGVLSRMKRTISLPTAISHCLTSSNSFHNKFETIQASSNESSLEGTPVHCQGHQLQQQRVVGPTLLHPSQSHTEGFGLANCSSPTSSGYASLADHNQSACAAGTGNSRHRPNSLNLGGGELKSVRTLLLPISDPPPKITSVVNPCALRLSGIEEEESRLLMNGQQNSKLVVIDAIESNEAGQSREKLGPASIVSESAPVVEEEASSSLLKSPSCTDHASVTTTSSATLSANCFQPCEQPKTATTTTWLPNPIDNSNNGLPPPAAVNNENACRPPVRACCCENRLFSPVPTAPIHQQQSTTTTTVGTLTTTRKLFFQNTINACQPLPITPGRNNNAATVRGNIIGSSTLAAGRSPTTVSAIPLPQQKRASAMTATFATTTLSSGANGPKNPAVQLTTQQFLPN